VIAGERKVAPGQRSESYERKSRKGVLKHNINEGVAFWKEVQGKEERPGSEAKPSERQRKKGLRMTENN